MNFDGFLLLPSKIHADVINDLQYRGAKMATMSEMVVKHKHQVYFWENYNYKHGLSKKNCTINELKMANFQGAFTNLYMRFFVLSWTLFMAVEQWLSGFVWHQNLLNMSPELWVFSSPGTTWYSWIHIVSYIQLVKLVVTFLCLNILT